MIKNNFRILKKQYAYLQTILKTPVKFQKDWPKTVGGVAYTRMVVGADGRTDGRTDRQTDGRTDTQNFGGFNIIPRHFLVAGHKKWDLAGVRSYLALKRVRLTLKECELTGMLMGDKIHTRIKNFYKCFSSVFQQPNHFKPIFCLEMHIFTVWYISVHLRGVVLVCGVTMVTKNVWNKFFTIKSTRTDSFHNTLKYLYFICLTYQIN